MVIPEPSRRRFLSFLAAVGGIGVLGGIVWAERKGPDAVPTAIGNLQTSTTRTGNTPSTTAQPPTATTSTSPPPTSTTSPPTTISTPPQRQSLAAICAEAWGALPVAGELTSHTIERLTVHHTAVLLDSNKTAPARARQHQQYHQELGWPDLAYHFLVDANGNVYEGRPVSTVGDTATEYDPTGHFLVCCEGHFDRQEIPEPQLLALVDVLAWAAEEFQVSPDTISGHRDWAATTCPGDHLYSHLASGSIEEAVNARLAAGGVSLNRLCGEDAAGLVAEIEAGLA